MPLWYVNDPYPGKCPRYIDIDGDGICDHSQPPPEERGFSSPDNSSPTSSFKANLNEESVKKVIITFFVVLSAVLLTEIIVRKGKVKATVMRYIWNIILLLLFILSAISGMLLLFIRDINFVAIHIVTSLLFLWGGAYHALKHINYYARRIRKEKKS